MIGIDTNILVRYIVRDHAGQAKKADAVMEALSENEPGFICSIVLAEFIWVLERSYNYSRSQITSLIETMLATQELEFEHTSAIWYALKNYESSQVGFTDLYIGRINRLHYCATTITFDKSASKTIDFELG